MTQPNFVAGYLVDPNVQGGREPLYLLLRRSETNSLPGIWQMVTGKLHPDEAAGAAVQREINEETGLVCSQIYNVDITMFYEQPKKRIAFSANFCGFVSSSHPVTLSAEEHDAYQWCTFSEAISLLAFPSQKQTLTFVHQFYVLQKTHAVNLLRL